MTNDSLQDGEMLVSFDVCSVYPFYKVWNIYGIYCRTSHSLMIKLIMMCRRLNYLWNKIVSKLKTILWEQWGNSDEWSIVTLTCKFIRNWIRKENLKRSNRRFSANDFTNNSYHRSQPKMASSNILVHRHISFPLNCERSENEEVS